MGARKRCSCGVTMQLDPQNIIESSLNASEYEIARWQGPIWQPPIAPAPQHRLFVRWQFEGMRHHGMPQPGPARQGDATSAQRLSMFGGASRFHSQTPSRTRFSESVSPRAPWPYALPPKAVNSTITRYASQSHRPGGAWPARLSLWRHARLQPAFISHQSQSASADRQSPPHKYRRVGFAIGATPPPFPFFGRLPPSFSSSP